MTLRATGPKVAVWEGHVSDISAFEDFGFDRPIALPARTGDGPVPHYLTAHYWWAYVHPNAVKVFERQWLVNLILWGNYRRLRDAALAELGDELPGKSLQVACVYGDLPDRPRERSAA